MVSFLRGAALCAVLLVAYLVLHQAQSQADLPARTVSSSVPPKAQEVFPNLTSDSVPIRAAVNLPPVTSSIETATPKQSNQANRIAFADLPLGVRGLMTQAAKKLNVSIASVTAGGIDAKSASDFAVLVDELREQYNQANANLSQEIERVKEAYLAAGTYERFSDEKEFVAALSIKLKDGFFRIPVEGEREGPNGPESFRYIITVEMSREPGLKAAQDYLSGFTEYRESLRDRSVSLFSR